MGVHLADKIYDTVIIGSGPAGYTAALYAARANLDTLVFQGFESGGQLMLTSDVENYPGYKDGVAGPDMLDDLEAQAARFGAEMRLDNVARGQRLRYLRRLLLQGEEGCGRWRRRHGDGGGALPHQVRGGGSLDPPARAVPGVQDHAAEGPQKPQDHLSHRHGGGGDPGRDLCRGRAYKECEDRRGADPRG